MRKLACAFYAEACLCARSKLRAVRSGGKPLHSCALAIERFSFRACISFYASARALLRLPSIHKSLGTKGTEA